MSEHQITVEQIVSIISFHTSNSEVLIEKHKNEFRRVINEFAREQRADATRELQRDNLRIRRALVNCALAVGASASDHSTIEFLELIPEEVRLSFSAKYDAIEKLRAELAAAKQQLAEAEKRASAAARFIDDETPKQHECDMLTDRGPCKRCDFQSAAHAARTAQAGIGSQNEVNKS